MTTRKFIGFFALVLSVVVLLPAQADADLIGVDLGWQYYGGGGPVTGGAGTETSGSFVGNGGVGGTYIEPNSNGPETVFNIDATATTITFDYSVAQVAGPWSGSPLSLSPTIDNGIAINLLSAGTFLSVAIDPATNMALFGSSDLSFTGNQIQINWASLAFSTSTDVTLDVTFASTPEPGTWSLMLLSLAVAGLAWRNKPGLRIADR